MNLVFSCHEHSKNVIYYYWYYNNNKLKNAIALILFNSTALNYGKGNDDSGYNIKKEVNYEN